jgi:hypothetical protein
MVFPQNVNFKPPIKDLQATQPECPPMTRANKPADIAGPCLTDYLTAESRHPKAGLKSLFPLSFLFFSYIKHNILNITRGWEPKSVALHMYVTYASWRRSNWRPLRAFHYIVLYVVLHRADRTSGRSDNFYTLGALGIWTCCFHDVLKGPATSTVVREDGEAFVPSTRWLAD